LKQIFLINIIGLIALLSACDTTPNKGSISQIQARLFTDSLQQVSDAGRQLQQPLADSLAFESILKKMDEGLGLAYQVEAATLDLLHNDLAKRFNRQFIKGVEEYRIGIEAGDETTQKNGLLLLQQWTSYWQKNRDDIIKTLEDLSHGATR
jgi:hypothetical protein